MNFLFQSPFVRISAGFIAGILLANYFPGYALTALGLCVFGIAGLAITLLIKRRHIVSTAAIYVLSGTIGLGYINVSISTTVDGWASLPEDVVMMTGIVQDYPGTTSSGEKVTVHPEAIGINDEVEHFPGEILLYFKPETFDKRLRPGDRITLPVRLSKPGFPMNPGSFDYGAYLKSKGVLATAFPAGNSMEVSRNACSGLHCWALRCRHYLEDVIDRHIELEEDRALVKALALGDRVELSNDHKEAFARAGAMHVLAVSGLHVGIVWLIVGRILGMFNRLKPPPFWKVAVVLLVIWTYATITGLSASVSRAATMFSFIVVGMGLNRKQHIFNSITASAFFLLLFDHTLLFDVGFQLSYCAVTGIVVLYPPLYHRTYIHNKYIDKVWALVCVSIAAQIATLPLVLYYFGRFPTWFLLTNIVAIPVAFGVLTSALALLFFDAIGFGGSIIAFVLNLFTRILNISVDGISDLPYAVVDKVWIGPVDLVLLSMLVIASSAWILYRRKRWAWLTAVSILLLCVNDLRMQSERTEQHFVIIPYSKSATEITMIKGKTSTHYMLGHVSPDAYYTDGLDQKFAIDRREIKYLEDTAGAMLRTGGAQYVLPGETSTVIEKDGELILVLRSRPDSSAIEEWGPRLVVIAGEASWYDARDIEEECRTSGIPYHNCRENGAWVRSIRSTSSARRSASVAFPGKRFQTAYPFVP